MNVPICHLQCHVILYALRASRSKALENCLYKSTGTGFLNSIKKELILTTGMLGTWKGLHKERLSV
jgi:hypothetical protein